jgi:hypothetical protein
VEVQNVTATAMVASWYIWWSRRQTENKEPVLSTEMSVKNIKAILANCLKLTGCWMASETKC